MRGKASYIKQCYPAHPFLLSVDETIAHVETNIDTGLTTEQVDSFQARYGPNKLSGEGGVKWYAVLAKQVSNALTLVLVLAMALAYGVSDYIEGGVITAVIVGNILIGFYQEFRAEQKMDALRSLSSPSATILRNGEVDTIPSSEVVPGDIVLVKAGDTVPADLRLVDGMNLECDEKILTGEAMPVAKDAEFSASSSSSAAASAARQSMADDQSRNAETKVGIGDRLNMVYSSSTITKGRGKGIVVFTGMHTEIGKIAASMQTKKRSTNKNRSMSRKKFGTLQVFRGGFWRTWDAIGRFLGLTTGTPLQIKLSKLAYGLFGCAIVLAIVVFGVNKFNITNEVAIYAISTGIAIIPESLIAVLTITMVVGMTQMHKRRVVVRQLSALEALGGVTNICSDKTGTLTQGLMVMRKAWVPGVGVYTLNESDDASDPSRGFVTLSSSCSHQVEKQSTAKGQNPQMTEQHVEEASPELGRFLVASSLCNLATVRYDKTVGKWQTNGDPTEIALQVFAHRFGQGKKTLESEGHWNQIAEYPFDSAIKRMSVVYRHGNDKPLIFTKGAVERIIDLCTSVGIGHHQTKMTAEMKAKVLEEMKSLAEQGLRVLAIAERLVPTDFQKNYDELPRDTVETDLTLLGLIGLYDPPRLETKEAIKECTNAGIRVHMLTGDHPSTATTIAKEVGIIPKYEGSLSAEEAASLVKTAAEFDSMTEEEINALPNLPLVIARCAPDTKTKMIAALHRRNRFAAMTGDGVNDAPSLQAADVGIAMGMGGSDVAKSASDIVLTDDNFASIVNAVEEGRRMFDNIQKFVLHLLSSNVGEVVLLIVGLSFQDNDGISVFPLSPLQILWINMLTSSFPAFGLGREKSSASIMRRPPHDMKKGVFTWQVIVDMVVYGVIMGTLTLLTFVIIVYGVGRGTPDLGVDCNRYDSLSCHVVFRARASVFAELTWIILILAWEIKSLENSMFNLDPLRARKEAVKFLFFRDVWGNQFLFWAVVIGALSVFPTIYIPGLNTDVFKHRGISWEWGLSFGGTILFVLAAEAWKWVKRQRGWFQEYTARNYASKSESDFGLISPTRMMTKGRQKTIP